MGGNKRLAMPTVYSSTAYSEVFTSAPLRRSIAKDLLGQQRWPREKPTEPLLRQAIWRKEIRLKKLRGEKTASQSWRRHSRSCATPAGAATIRNSWRIHPPNTPATCEDAACMASTRSMSLQSCSVLPWYLNRSVLASTRLCNNTTSCDGQCTLAAFGTIVWFAWGSRRSDIHIPNLNHAL